ncbi:MAG: NAD(P)-binding domain-containing protein, partial [Leuconostoc mesenteroides]
MNYGFIGAGNMATAMIKGLIYAGIDSKNIYVSSPHCAAK